MSDESGDGTVYPFPGGGDPSYVPPPIPFYGDTSPEAEADFLDAPERPEESDDLAVPEIPAVPCPIAPDAALTSKGYPATARKAGAEDSADGEFVAPRSLADRLGDWLDHRIALARNRIETEAPYREAEIARKTALLQAQTEREIGLMEQQTKLRAAQMKAQADWASAKGKSDAAAAKAGRSPAGIGADKGRGKPSGTGFGGGRGTGTNGSTSGSGSARSTRSGNSPKDGGKDPDRSTGGRNSGAKGDAGGSNGRQNGSGGSGSSGKKGSSTGSSGGFGKGGSGNSGSGKGGSKDDGNKTRNPSASSPASDRAHGRQERAAARQHRRSANQAANLADRSKDRDQDRANRQAAWEERRAAKAEWKAARKAKREAAKASDAGRTTLGAAVVEEAQRRWDKRRADDRAKAEKKSRKEGEPSGPRVDLSKDMEWGGAGGKGTDATTKKMPKDGSKPSADGSKGACAPSDSEDDKKGSEKPSDLSGKRGPKDAPAADGSPPKDRPQDPADEDDRPTHERIKEQLRRARENAKAKAKEEARAQEAGRAETESEESNRPRRPEDFGATFGRPDRPEQPPLRPNLGQDEVYPDAFIVDDPADPLRAYVASPAGLAPAPEPHTKRPGTTRPTAQESTVNTEVNKTSSAQVGLSPQHRTDITFDEYLMGIANIAIAAGSDKDRAQALGAALGKAADALRDMATDLAGDHNIATEVTNHICNLADAAARMKMQAERCATECEAACEAAKLAAVAVSRTYSEDIQAMDAAGLAHASAAAHHD